MKASSSKDRSQDRVCIRMSMAPDMMESGRMMIKTVLVPFSSRMEMCIKEHLLEESAVAQECINIQMEIFMMVSGALIKRKVWALLKWQLVIATMENGLMEERMVKEDIHSRTRIHMKAISSKDFEQARVSTLGQINLTIRVTGNRTE